jgi:hypothetical protein
MGSKTALIDPGPARRYNVKPKEIDRKQWMACTPGEFIRDLVDEGDVAVIWRVANMTEPDDEGAFIMVWEVVSVPAGHVTRTIDSMSVNAVSKRLSAFIAEGVVE